ncbi:squalene epoxidase-domain-containing protein [Piptocephalis cylindrospora]|uniref:Squalene monooxygenase n=1 Tax=Piptocephalis cylindrospora TaxID=1907219 RepID=A0A4P9XY43_9FUNG|nr:squalene epoxidase-domain-containing protein [Piptocephalis cylindrospora]|eukprot:RKP11318.1 squalene epoxidase-domain-containing protein [Piptocephalis cylindrospora]
MDTYDVIIIGAGIVGSALGAVLGRDGRRVLVLERDLTEPDRIVGELLQPGGCKALEELGLSDCLVGIDAIPTYGYGILHSDQTIMIPYNDLEDPTISQGIAKTDLDSDPKKLLTGRSFHHGRFIQKLRQACASAPGTELKEATVTDLIYCEMTGKVIGIECIQRLGGPEGSKTKHQYLGSVTVSADGCFSKFRKQALARPVTSTSNFVGLILQDCPLPFPNHGHVVITKRSPSLLYQIGTRETRLLVNIPGKLPSTSNGDLKRYMQAEVLSDLPKSLHSCFLQALENDRLRSMPNSYLAPSTSSIDGLIVLGDAMNMRHPLTGGGMTVGLKDVALLRKLLSPQALPDLAATDMVMAQIQCFHWSRKYYSSTVNILAQALYALFSASPEDTLMVYLQNACMAYFQQGGSCISGPVGLLSG